MAGELPVSGKPIIGYRGSTHSLLFRFNDEDGNPIDLDQNYPTIQFRIFKPGKEDDPEVDKTTDDGISILNTNEASLKVSKENTKKLFGKTLYFELRYILANDEEDAWYANRYLLRNAASGGGEEENTFEFTYDSTTHELSISSSSNDAASAANSEAQAKTYRDETETLKQDVETLIDNSVQDIEDARDSALSEIDSSETDAITAIEQAETDGITAVENARDQGISAVENARDSAISDINDLVTQAETARDEAQTAASNAATSETNAATSESNAATSETNAAQSATTATNEADRAETEADRAEAEANNAATEIQEKIIEAHAFYIKDQSDIDIEPTVILGPSEGIGEHPAVNLTRNSGGNSIGRIGDLRSFGNDEWRYNYNRETGAPTGRYIEGQATRLNTQFSSPSTNEDVTVDSVEHSISFWGSGSITLSGAHSETINGTDSVTRTTASFTPSAGTLTISPSGDVEFLQLEEGSAATSPIAGDGQQKTRDPDIATVTDLDAINFNPSEGTFVCDINVPDSGYGDSKTLLTLDDGTSDNRIQLLLNDSDGELRILSVKNSTSTLEDGSTQVIGDATICMTLEDGVARGFVNGAKEVEDNSFQMPSVSQIRIGRNVFDSAYFDGLVRSIPYYQRAVSESQGQALTS